MLYLFFAHCQAVDGYDGNAVLAFKIFCERFGLRLGRSGAVEHDHERLVYCGHFGGDAFFGFDIAFTRNLAEGTVGGDEKSYRRMLGYDLLRAQLSRFFKRHCRFRPGSHHHPRLTVLVMTQCGGDDIAHAVDHAQVKAGAFVDVYMHRFLGYELRFGRHDRFTRCGLRHFVARAVLHELALYVRDCKVGYEPLYEC